jgi:large subunit ribosomal protein L32
MRVKAPSVVECGTCGNRVLLHRVCGKCGHYRGKLVLETAEIA